MLVLVALVLAVLAVAVLAVVVVVPSHLRRQVRLHLYVD
jgi:hypothetical protein